MKKSVVTFLSLFVLVGLSDIIKFVEQMKHVGKGDYDIISAAYFVLLKILFALFGYLLFSVIGFLCQDHGPQ